MTDVICTLRLFADDSILYTEVKNRADQIKLQDDLHRVFKWAEKWQMSFNASKCQKLTITRKTKPHTLKYKVDNHHIESTANHKYLGVNINSNMDWKHHIQNITSSARSTLAILRRNISSCLSDVKSRAYQALVRPKLEYSSAAWNPHQQDQVNRIEAIQRQAARFVSNNYERTASVTDMLKILEWESLATRRLLNQCSMFYKIHFSLVNIPFPSCVIPATRQGRANNILSFNIIQSRVNTYKYSFFVRTIPIWNRLPTTVVQASSIKQFQTLALPVLREMQPTSTHQKL